MGLDILVVDSLEDRSKGSHDADVSDAVTERFESLDYVVVGSE